MKACDEGKGVLDTVTLDDPDVTQSQGQGNQI